MPYTILIVDDSGTMRNVIKKILRISGIQVGACLEAGNGQEALQQLEQNRVDLVLSDVHMPVMDGFGLLKELRQRECWKDLPVVLITTEANEERINEAKRLGAVDYLNKPFSPESLRSVLMPIMGETDASAIRNSDEGCDF